MARGLRASGHAGGRSPVVPALLRQFRDDDLLALGIDLVFVAGRNRGDFLHQLGGGARVGVEEAQCAHAGQAVEGQGATPVAVAQMTMSISSGEMPALSSARLAAEMPRVALFSSGPQILRSQMPVLATIQSLLVSTFCEISSFVTMRSGSAMPTPRKPAPLQWLLELRSVRSSPETLCPQSAPQRTEPHSPVLSATLRREVLQTALAC